jgi:ABC-type amino acid transport substrate-binding protein
MRVLVLLLAFILNTHIYAETLVVGLPPFSPPFVMTADNKNHYIGFSIDIMSEVCKQMQVKCRYKSFTFGDTFTQLINNAINLAIGSFTITEERMQIIRFSLPILDSQATFLALADSPYATIDALAGKTVAAEADSVFVEYVTQKYGQKIKIISYPSIAELMIALENKDVDAVVFDIETAYFWIGNNNDMFKTVGAPFHLGQGIGIMANRNNQALIERVNQALLSMEKDGRYLRIYDTYFGTFRQTSGP